MKKITSSSARYVALQIRFGENASALTSEQLNAIRLNGRRVKLSSTGWVREDIGLCIHIF